MKSTIQFFDVHNFGTWSCSISHHSIGLFEIFWNHQDPSISKFQVGIPSFLVHILPQLASHSFVVASSHFHWFKIFGVSHHRFHHGSGCKPSHCIFPCRSAAKQHDTCTLMCSRQLARGFLQQIITCICIYIYVHIMLLYYSIFYYIILYYIILYYIMLYYILSYYIMLCIYHIIYIYIYTMYYTLTWTTNL